MKIILDVMGGDNPPEEFVKGAVLARKKYGEQITLVGNENLIHDALKKEGALGAGFEIVNAEDFVTMEDDPMSITGIHKESSMATALKLLADGHGDAVVSAGNTGALFTGATLFARRIKGVRRAALASLIQFNAPVMVLDCGANVTVTPEYLVQFAYLGSIYMERVVGIKSPRVALLNNGAETHKGTPLVIEAHKLLSEAEGINFIGNVEGKDIPVGGCDVVVTDGFTGNVFLKTTEGMGKFVNDRLHLKIFGGLRGKISEWLKAHEIKLFSRLLDVKEYGGAPFLGLAKPVIKAHGNSDAVSICSAIGQARKYVNVNVIDEIAARADTFPKIKIDISSRKKETES